MRRGQATLDYVCLLGILIATLIAMGIYMKRGFQGKYRELGEQIGSQYSPNATVSTLTNQTISDTNSTITNTVNKVYSAAGVTISAQNQQDDTQGSSEMHSRTQDTTGALESGGD
ncbi:MAG: hypothetical protein ABSE81_07070 [Candidatus Omnitrophota bacterium]|jgi:uncharacterized protein (UPF0333 family)